MRSIPDWNWTKRLNVGGILFEKALVLEFHESNKNQMLYLFVQFLCLEIHFRSSRKDAQEETIRNYLNTIGEFQVEASTGTTSGLCS